MKEEKPTREERLKAYEYARECLNKNLDSQTGICALLKRSIYLGEFNIKDYPELMEAKPYNKGHLDYWFSSAKERIQVLTKIINKMKEEPLIKPGQQFKIDSIEELKEAYEKLSPWRYGLDIEIKDFIEDKNYRWVHYCEITRQIYLYHKHEDYETIPNPLKKDEVLTLIKYAETAMENHYLREELKALREEVEKLKGEKEEKPKESEDLKIKWNHCELSTESDMWEWCSKKTIAIRVKDSRGECSIPIEKPDAIKIVNYLKKHFEI